MKASALINKRVLVVGLGVTGLSVVRYLSREGVAFEVADENASDDALPDIPDIPGKPVLHNSFTRELFCCFDVLILSPGIPRAHPAVAAALDAGIDVIGDIELFADAVEVPVIAVTGSNGKSTVVAWLAFSLTECGVKAEACGNIGKPALDCLGADAAVLVLELSSYQLESTRSLQPLCAAVLNVSDDHLDRYDDIEHYASVKRRVYQHAQHCVANFDDTRTWPTGDVTHACIFITHGLSDSQAISSGERNYDRSMLDGISLSVPGDHNVSNALAVLALAEPLEVSEACLLASLPRFRGLAHRSEFIAEHEGIRWYNDSKGTNVDACEKAIMAMPGPVVLIAGGIGKGADFTPLQSIVRQYVKLLVLIGQDKEHIASVLGSYVETVMAESLTEAVAMARSRAIHGDVVLLSPACASFDMFRNFEDRGEQYSAAVHEVLAA